MLFYCAQVPHQILVVGWDERISRILKEYFRLVDDDDG